MTTNQGLLMTGVYQDAVVALSLVLAAKFTLFNQGNEPISIWVGPSAGPAVQPNAITVMPYESWPSTYVVASGEGLFAKAVRETGTTRLVFVSVE